MLNDLFPWATYQQIVEKTSYFSAEIFLSCLVQNMNLLCVKHAWISVSQCFLGIDAFLGNWSFNFFSEKLLDTFVEKDFRSYFSPIANA